MIYDFENLMTDVLEVLTGKLNTKLTALDTEKNDGITLKQVDSAAYFFQTLNGVTLNFDPVVIYSIEDMESNGHGPMTSTTTVISVILIMEDDGTTNLMQKILRYQRALREIFEEDFMNNSHGVKMTIKNLPPSVFQMANTSNPFRITGISIEAGMG